MLTGLSVAAGAVTITVYFGSTNPPPHLYRALPPGPASVVDGSERTLQSELTMAVSKDLLDILVCPLCKVPVHLVHYETGLKCDQCKRVYPIRDDIPVMLIDEAEIEE